MKRGEKPRMEDYESKHQYPSQTIVRILLRTFPSQQGRDGQSLEYLFLFFSAGGRKLMNKDTATTTYVETTYSLPHP